MNKKTWARTVTRAGALAAGLLLFLGSGAQAAELVTSENSTGVDGGQVLLPLQAPLDLCGDHLNVGGEATAECSPDGGARALIGPGGIADMHSNDNAGIVNGLQIQAPAQVPVNACGIAATAFGTAHAACAGSADAVLGTGAETVTPTMDTRDNEGILNGTQLLAPIQVPVNVCGIAVSGLGNAHASCAGSATATRGATVGMSTGDNHGVGNGDQFAVPVQVPVNVCGNAVAALGDASADCEGDGDFHTMGTAPRANALPQVAPAANLPLLGGSGEKSAAGSVHQSAASSERADVLPSLVSEGNHLLGEGDELLVPLQGPSNVEGLVIGLGSTAGAASLGGATAVS
ncbi:chaplin family protein [Phytomonospora endophytica]|uniref:Chaplin domain-containing protein n=1 Tax=Phytomonospora endophytica TaxID=714109 RepID=A0A841FXD7_9ACTN|nr:chaplin family protein [Phytomonospora endophytica]MBB6038398.1 hypothetical protein [Phytomonospora endophytica]GIG64328.1 hypothetical protein Pen01_06230 [Phytomonospora endophytica]